MLRALNRARSAFERHAVGELPPLVVRNLKHYWKSLRSTPISCEFDEQHSTETDKVCEIGELNIKSPNSKYAVRYQPSSPEAVKRILARLNICYETFTFVDFGAGKGRVLLIAAEFPFANVIGIEFSSELVKIARTNIDRFQKQSGTAKAIDVLLADVTECQIPTAPLVCYFYNPFQRPVLARVEAMLTKSLSRSPRDVYVIYVHPEHGEVFDGSRAWTVHIEEPSAVVYKSQSTEVLV